MSGYRGLHGFRICLLLAVVPVQVRTMLFTFKNMSHSMAMDILLQCIEWELDLVSVSMYILG